MNLNAVPTYPAYSLGLLLLASLMFRGSSDYSVLSISVCLIALAAFCFISFLRGSKRITITPHSILITTWLVWISILPIMGLVSNNSIFGFFQCSLWIMAFSIFSMSHSPDRLWNTLSKLIWVLGVVSAVYALAQLFIQHSMPSGFFASKNTAAAFLMMATLLLIGRFISNPLLKKTVNPSKMVNYNDLVLSGCIYIMTFAMFVTLSRGATIAFASFLFMEILLLRQHISKRRLVQLVGIVLFALLSLLILAQPAIHHRLDLLHNEKSRFVIWQGAWHLWQAAPWYGIGIFNFNHYYPAFSLAGDGSSLEYAHNDFLQLLIETGIPGATLLISMVLAFTISVWNYLRSPSLNAIKHINIVSCFVAIGALAIHSVVDFNFYVLAMNLMLGCCLGYLYSELNYHGSIKMWVLNITPRTRQILAATGVLVLLFVGVNALRFYMLNIYSKKADQATLQEDFDTALIYNAKGLKWLDNAKVHSHQADLYLQLANIATSDAERKQLTKHAETAINHSLVNNPYFARAYFQMGLLQSLLLNDAVQAEHFFYKAIENNPQFSLARVTLAVFLIEQGDLQRAQTVLETGLNFPIYADNVETYLNYLAKLRFENGYYKQAQQVTNKLDDLDLYSNDYSQLALSD